MDLKKGMIFFICSLFVSQLSADWKRQAAVQAADEKQYPLLIESLQKEFDGIPDAGKAVVCLLIGYCQSRLPDPRAELLWMRKYLEEFRAADVDLGFLPPTIRQKIRKFKLSWQQDFPVLWELAPAVEHAEFAFFDPPSVLNLRLQVSLPCDFQLFSREGGLLVQGVLGKGVETVQMPLAADFRKTASHHFRLRLTLRHAPEKTVEKYFTVELQYICPENTSFDPLTAELKLNGREFQPESRTETRVVSRRTHFDKAVFKKDILKSFLVGTGFFVISSTLLKSTIDNPDTSLYAKSALYGTRRAFNLAGFAFSLSALSRLPRAFKRERISEEITLDIPEARAANEALRQDLEQARKQVRVKLSFQTV